MFQKGGHRVCTVCGCTDFSFRQRWHSSSHWARIFGCLWTEMPPSLLRCLCQDHCQTHCQACCWRPHSSGKRSASSAITFSRVFFSMEQSVIEISNSIKRVEDEIESVQQKLENPEIRHTHETDEYLINKEMQLRNKEGQLREEKQVLLQLQLQPQGQGMPCASHYDCGCTVTRNICVNVDHMRNHRASTGFLAKRCSNSRLFS